MEQKQIQKISKNMIINEILAQHPSKVQILSEIMMDFGIHCIGCGAAGFETLEEGVLGHGFTEAQLDKLVNDLNVAVKNSAVTQKKEVTDLKITLTSMAIEKVKEIMKKENKENEILRVAVLAGGCSGYTYDLEVVPETPETDIKKEIDGLKISIDRDSAEFLDGCEIDFVDTLNESGFKFNNPNSTKECGCGKSFS